MKPTRKSPLRSLTRLAIGGIALGLDELSSRLTRWDERGPSITSIRADLENPPPQLPAHIDDMYSTAIQEGTIEATSIPSANETNTDLLRYAVIGLVFQSEERAESALHTLDRATRVLGNLAEPLFAPVYSSRLFSPFRRSFESLVQRGEKEVNQWINIGRDEEPLSRSVAQTALVDTMDSSIEFLAEKPEVLDLVQAQSLSLAGEIIEEVRERSVSGDQFIEGLVRMMLRKPMRAELPGPPSEIMAEAAAFRQIQRGSRSML